ncbi:hypothetical protein XELAEV_18031877mg [Xenopus laevis]|uniref:Uncharacterized protein n=1 Tax=Xenopus laevis TaxID=8355 RepID=A0A974CQR5_XENLA|nr:hypothetical protein XELAEV_18031877mg [Xenopus laevis]
MKGSNTLSLSHKNLPGGGKGRPEFAWFPPPPPPTPVLLSLAAEKQKLLLFNHRAAACKACRTETPPHPSILTKNTYTLGRFWARANKVFALGPPTPQRPLSRGGGSN